MVIRTQEIWSLSLSKQVFQGFILPIHQLPGVKVCFLLFSAPLAPSPQWTAVACSAPRLCLHHSNLLWCGLLSTCSCGVALSVSDSFLGSLCLCESYLIVSVGLGELSVLLLCHLPRVTPGKEFLIEGFLMLWTILLFIMLL